MFEAFARETTPAINIIVDRTARVLYGVSAEDEVSLERGLYDNAPTLNLVLCVLCLKVQPRNLFMFDTDHTHGALVFT